MKFTNCKLQILAVAFLVAANAAAADWPQFRGPNGDGLSTAKDIPVHWTATENVAWKTPIPGKGWSSPILADGSIYLTAAAGDANKDEAVALRALAIDASNGQIIWDKEVLSADSAAAKQMHSKNSLASATPVIDGDRLYVYFGHMGTAALDRDGNILWKQQRVTYEPVHGNGGSPALVDDLIVFSCDAARDPFVVALDRKTGDVRWRTPRDSSAANKFSFCTPTVIENDGAKQIISPGSGFVGAYQPSDGHELWRVTYGDGYSVTPRPVFAGGLLYVCSGFNSPSLLAIDPKAATGDATDEHIIWKRERGVPLTPSPLVIGDEVYIVSDNGIATCLDAHSGDVHWSKRLGGAFSASPVSAEGRIYFQNEDGTVYVVRADKTYELLATNEMAERALASPAVTDGALILRTENHLWRIAE